MDSRDEFWIILRGKKKKKKKWSPYIINMFKSVQYVLYNTWFKILQHAMSRSADLQYTGCNYWLFLLSTNIFSINLFVYLMFAIFQSTRWCLQCCVLSKQQSKCQRYFHIKQKKATNPHNGDAGTRERLTILLENDSINYQNGWQLIYCRLVSTSHWYI